MIEIVRADPVHVYWIDLRSRDRESFFAFEQVPTAAIIEYIKKGLSWTAFYNGEVACIWGAVQESAMTGAKLWMVGSKIIEEHALLFLRHSKRFIDAALRAYSYLYCYVDVDYVTSANWLEWAGFKIVDVLQVKDIKIYKYELRAT